MKWSSHLSLREVRIRPGAEWRQEGPGWCFFRLAQGEGYWMDKAAPRALSTGDVVVIPAAVAGNFRASVIRPVRGEYFLWRPDMLHGLLTVAERNFFNAKVQDPVRVFTAAEAVAGAFAGAVTEKSGETNFIERSRLLQLVVATFAEELRRYTPPAEAASADDRFQKVMQEITESELPNFTLEDLAQRCGCSGRHFSRMFQKHYGVPVRTKQTRLRLQKASQLLSETNTKIIHVALESGYRNLGLFNTMFKKYLGMTPSEWRTQHAGKGSETKAAKLLGCILGFLLLGANLLPAQTNVAPAAKPEPQFAVERYQIEGNTLFPEETLAKILRDYTGTNVTFATIRAGLSELQLAYRGRGYVTVSVSLPQQQLTNGIVRVQVTEGRLSEINVVNNRYFSSNNVRAALPSLETNLILNSLVFQRDLDQANANRDRQIYPEIGPGPEPGTTILNLKVKDRLPLHGRFDVNNLSTPGTPEMRINSAFQYNNLWQLDHQIGVQYNFVPGEYKDKSDLLQRYFFDRPLIASYSAFYRMPVKWSDHTDGRQISVSEFGYDEVARRFRPPPPESQSEIIAYASRSTSDTNFKLQSESLTPSTISPSGSLQISDRVDARTISFNENLGFRWTKPLEKFLGISSSLGAGMDYKSYHATVYQHRVFKATLYIPEVGPTGPPFTEFASPPVSSTREIPSSVDYLPFSLNWDAFRADKGGSSSLYLNNSFNFAGLPSERGEFTAVSGSTNATGTFYVLNAGFTREQKIYDEWSVTLRANGQWATEPLVSNEQFGLGGTGGPRGYREGEEYGDTGWRVSIEPKTPLVDVGLVDGDMPMRVRGLTFLDYGERYLLEPGTRAGTQKLCGGGFGFVGSIGQTFDFRFALAWPLISTPSTPVGRMHLYFGIGAQF